MERYLGDRTGEEYRAHMDLIKSITDDWHNGKIGTREKRARIAAENAAFYNGQQLGAAGGAITSEPRMTDEIAHVIADGSGVPMEAISAALRARRRASIRAANADSVEEARRLSDEGLDAYTEILATAR